MSSWHDVVDPLAKQMELAVMFDGEVNHNAVGCKALSGLLREMARIMDNEIVAREKRRLTIRLFGLTITVARDE